MDRYCPPLTKYVADSTFCSNSSFWQDKPCGHERMRCMGRSAGKCYPKHCLCNPECTREQACEDMAHMICPGERPVCLQSDMFMCSNRAFCVHKDTVCNGHLNCPDGSDEHESHCGQCPNQFTEVLATYPCQHRHTGLTVCSIPCNKKDDFCMDWADEQCQIGNALKYLLLFGSGIILMAATLVISQRVYAKNFESAAMEEMQELNVTGSVEGLCESCLLAVKMPYVAKTEFKKRRKRAFREFCSPASIK